MLYDACFYFCQFSLPTLLVLSYCSYNKYVSIYNKFICVDVRKFVECSDDQNLSHIPMKMLRFFRWEIRAICSCQWDSSIAVCDNHFTSIFHLYGYLIAAVLFEFWVTTNLPYWSFYLLAFYVHGSFDFVCFSQLVFPHAFDVVFCVSFLGPKLLWLHSEWPLPKFTFFLTVGDHHKS